MHQVSFVFLFQRSVLVNVFYEIFFVLFCVFQKLVVEKIFTSRTRRFIFIQTFCNKVIELSGPLSIYFFKSFEIFFQYFVVQRPLVAFLEMGRFSMGQFYTENAERPHINCHSICLLRIEQSPNNFRC